MKIEKEKKVVREDNEEMSLLLKVPIYKIGTYTIDIQKRMLIRGDSKKLTIKELNLLVLLAANANKLLDRKYALKVVWKDDNYYNARSMDVYICKLRKLLLGDSEVIIINIHGKGYKLIIPE